MVNKSSARDVESLGEFYKFLLFIAAMFVLALYLQIVRNRKYWVMMEAGFGILYVISFPFAHYLLTFYSLNVDDHHFMTFLFRLVLLGLIAQATAIYLTKDSRDPTVGLSVSVTNVLSRGTILLCYLHEVYYGELYAKNPGIMKIESVAIFLLVVGDVMHMSKLTTNEGSRTVGDPISLHLSIDALITFFLGSLIFGFSDMFLGILNSKFKIQAGYLFMTKLFGSILFGGSVLSFASLCYKHDDDAVTTLKSKLTIYLPTLLLAITNALIDKFYQNAGHSILMIGVVGALAVNAGYAVWQHEKKKRE